VIPLNKTQLSVSCAILISLYTNQYYNLNELEIDKANLLG